MVFLGQQFYNSETAPANQNVLALRSATAHFRTGRIVPAAKKNAPKLVVALNMQASEAKVDINRYPTVKRQVGSIPL
jgi:hypothetical protein